MQQQQHDGRWVQINESRTSEGGTITSWMEITQLKRREQALAILVEGRADSSNFLDTAAKALAIGIGYRWAGVGRFLDNGRAKVLAMWDTDHLCETFEYTLAGTPCADVASGKDYCYYPCRVAETFPHDEHLRELDAASFHGQAIRDAAGHLIGHVFAINNTPDHVEAKQNELMSIVARWIGIAIQQQNAEDALRDSEDRARDFAASASDWFWETDLDQRFTYYSGNGPLTISVTSLEAFTHLRPLPSANGARISGKVSPSRIIASRLPSSWWRVSRSETCNSNIHRR
jgi:PAS domain-containing protein